LSLSSLQDIMSLTVLMIGKQLEELVRRISKFLALLDKDMI
jgi:hypothetical protein